MVKSYNIRAQVHEFSILSLTITQSLIYQLSHLKHFKNKHINFIKKNTYFNFSSFTRKLNFESKSILNVLNITKISSIIPLILKRFDFDNTFGIFKLKIVIKLIFT